MRLVELGEDTGRWQFTTGEAPGTVVKAGIIAASGAAMLLGDANAQPWLIGGGFAVGALVGVRVVIDLLGRASELVDAHRLREAQIDPAVVRLHAERELVTERRLLVESIQGLPAEALEYAKAMLDATGAVVDGNRVQWRLGGHEFSVFHASAWLDVYANRDDKMALPADSDWRPSSGVTREEWRVMASAMVSALVRLGRAQGAASQYRPRWTTTDGRLQEDALNLTGVYLAHNIALGFASKGAEEI